MTSSDHPFTGAQNRGHATGLATCHSGRTSFRALTGDDDRWSCVSVDGAWRGYFCHTWCGSGKRCQVRARATHGRATRERQQVPSDKVKGTHKRGGEAGGTQRKIAE